jgi:hypothetical protein
MSNLRLVQSVLADSALLTSQDFNNSIVNNLNFHLIQFVFSELTSC